VEDHNIDRNKKQSHRREKMIKKVLPIIIIGLMVLSAGAASASYINEQNIPDNALFTKKESTSEINVGKTMTYTLTLTNPNTGGAEDNFNNVQISDTIPNGLEVTKVEGGTHIGNVVSADIGTLAPGESKTIVITVKALAKGKYVNTAYLQYTVKETKKLVYNGEKHTHDGTLINDQLLISGGQNYNANNFAVGEQMGCYHVEQVQLHSNHYNQFNQQNYCNPQNHNEQDQQNCCEHKWALNCQHKDKKCCKYVTKCVQRTAEASADPLVVDSVTPVTPETPTIAVKEPTIKAQEETVGMQETGVPIVALLLAGFMLFSGMLLPKLK
jgi:fimbrial isopeptide formation D2 family protein